MRRMGQFRLKGREIIDYITPIKMIMGKCAILRAEHMLHSDSVEYIAICDQFDLLGPGEEAPFYEWVWDGSTVRAKRMA